MEYMIHTCNSRRWYVNKFLIPSLLNQGIDKKDITIMVDVRGEGNLISTMKTFDFIGRVKDWSEVTWHLQDDVVICSDFKQRTEELYGDVICGFCSRYDNSKRYGLVSLDEMWYSFPCIGIKNRIAKECGDWFFQKAIYEKEHQSMISTRKHDDEFFRMFLTKYRPDTRAFNVRPNLVNHVDYLLGGSISNPFRKDAQVLAYYWDEPHIIRDLERAILAENTGNIAN